jgi:ABC-type Fe3+-hydroxamate transport system substrate-binding protein
MKTVLRYSLIAITLSVLVAGPAVASAKGPKPVSGKKFDAAAQAALEAMKAKAAELKIQGVAVVSFAPGDTIESWTSQMAVVGHMTDHLNGEKGNNLLAIAYAKASEMANTLKDSGTSGKPPMTGEFGWQGGVVAKTARGTIIVAFSGGKSEDDVQVSKAGLALLQSKL